MVDSVYFGYTQTQTSAYYRMMCFVKVMNEIGDIVAYTNEYDPDRLNAQVDKLEQELANPERQAEIESEFLFLIHQKGIKLGIFQLFASCWGLSLIDLFHHFMLPVITEVDDYAFGINTDNPNYEAFNPDSDTIKVIRAQLRCSDALIVSTEELKDKYSSLCDKIYVVPNMVDFSIWDKLKNNVHKTYINIGWEGGSAHRRDLEIIEPVVHKILKKYKNVRFTFIGGDESIPESFLDKKRIIVKKVWKPITQYPAFKALQGFDIELAPLFDTEFNRCKSNLRWLEASALKIPTVASNVGPYQDCTAELCIEEDEWFDAICKLVDNKTYRKSLGKLAYKAVKKRFNLVNIADTYTKILKSEIKLHKARVKRIEAAREED